LCKSEPSGQAIDNRPDDKVLLHANGGIPRLRPVAIREIETNEILEVQDCCGQRIKLIAQPEIGEAHVEERRGQATTRDSPQPKPSVVMEHMKWIGQKQHHNQRERQRIDERRYGQTGAVQETQHAERPNDPENRRQLHEMLLG